MILWRKRRVGCQRKGVNLFVLFLVDAVLPLMKRKLEVLCPLWLAIDAVPFIMGKTDKVDDEGEIPLPSIVSKRGLTGDMEVQLEKEVVGSQVHDDSVQDAMVGLDPGPSSSSPSIHMSSYEPMDTSLDQNDLLDEEDVIEVDSDDGATVQFLTHDPMHSQVDLQSLSGWTPLLTLFPDDEACLVEFPWSL
ncbi:hypothetical protein L6452_22609 [Arctium lappa]|uniref:Uncharacterized protein n=1 Tax=Arctium lappa TaxID=4217 RepID=A0ACB9B208_ARCLA|nr:hypothetical protein L6452_22609 [Arctium lappa]